MLRDYNKGITTNIIYNYLNLPSQITFASGKIEYFYDAIGTKQKKKVTNGAVITTTDYAGNYIYQNNALQMINQPEGYIEPNTAQTVFNYGYRLKDHLGNIRLTFVDFDHNGSIALSEITEEDNYYPFGLKHQGYNFVVTSNTNAAAGKFKYNGKELQDDLIGSNSLDLYDYGARMYDPALGRWHVIDPQAERYSSMSPYNYVANNPMLFIDPNGEEVWIYYTDDDGNEQQMQYTAGMKYKGGNEFVETSVKYLNQMSTTENGGNVLGALIESENTFNMTNTFAKDKNGNDVKGALAFAGSEEGGGQIHAGELLNENMAEGAKLESTSHELFHGYQHENGQGGASIFNEVEAMVFSVSVASQYSFDNNTLGGGSSTPLGKDNTSVSQTYQNSFQKLIYNTTFQKDAFVAAVKNFKQGAAKNTSGDYNSYPLRRSNQTKSLLGRFYPLIK